MLIEARQVMRSILVADAGALHSYVGGHNNLCETVLAEVKRLSQIRKSPDCEPWRPRMGRGEGAVASD